MEESTQFEGPVPSVLCLESSDQDKNQGGAITATL